jgi:3-oxoadipate enol-lactonase
LGALWRVLGPRVAPSSPGPQVRPAGLPGRLVEVGRREFGVREEGPVDGPPVVLIHGWAYDSLGAWFRVASLLAGTSRVIAVDLRSHGKSDRGRGQAQIDDLADDVASVLEVLALGPVAVVGYSMGGMVAQSLARRHPGRVSRLVLLASAARALRGSGRSARALLVGGRVLSLLDPSFLPRLSHRYLVSRGVVAPEHSAWLWERLMDRDPDLYFDAASAIISFDSRPWVGRLQMPVLCIILGRDQVIPVGRQRETAAAIPGAEVVEIEGARHEAALTHPEQVAAAILRFVAGLVV